MIQGQYGMQNELGPHGNFELCVAVGEAVWQLVLSRTFGFAPATMIHDLLVTVSS